MRLKHLITLLCQNSWFQSYYSNNFFFYRSPPNEHRKYNTIYINIKSLSLPVTNIYFLYFFRMIGKLSGIRTLTIDMQTISIPLFFLLYSLYLFILFQPQQVLPPWLQNSKCPLLFIFWKNCFSQILYSNNSLYNCFISSLALHKQLTSQVTNKT